MKHEPRFFDVVSEDLQIVAVREKDAQDKEGWRKMNPCGNS